MLRGLDSSTALDLVTRILYINTDIPNGAKDIVPTEAPLPKDDDDDEDELSVWIIFSIPFMCFCFFSWGMLCAKGLLASSPPTQHDDEERNEGLELAKMERKKFLQSKLTEFFVNHFEREGAVSTCSNASFPEATSTDKTLTDKSDECLDEESQTKENEHSAMPQCAVCLEDYQTGDTLVASTNDLCQHVFHKDCILPCLTSPVLKKAMITNEDAFADVHSINDSMPCPCCRQTFCTLTSEEGEALCGILASKATATPTTYEEEGD